MKNQFMTFSVSLYEVTARLRLKDVLYDFLRKILNWGFWWKRSKNEFFKFYNKFALNFLYFLHEVTAARRLNIG